MSRGGPERHINSGKVDIHIPFQSANGQDQILKNRGQGTPAEQNNQRLGGGEPVYTADCCLRQTEPVTMKNRNQRMELLNERAKFLGNGKYRPGTIG